MPCCRIVVSYNFYPFFLHTCILIALGQYERVLWEKRKGKQSGRLWMCDLSVCVCARTRLESGSCCAKFSPAIFNPCSKKEMGENAFSLASSSLFSLNYPVFSDADCEIDATLIICHVLS